MFVFVTRLQCLHDWRALSDTIKQDDRSINYNEKLDAGLVLEANITEANEGEGLRKQHNQDNYFLFTNTIFTTYMCFVVFVLSVQASFALMM